MTTGAQIIAKAESYLGQTGKRFWKDYGCPEGWAWCVIFVWDIFRLCNASNLFCDGQKVAGCGIEKNWLDKNCTKVSLSQAQQGDIVMFSWRAGEISHTGFAINPLSSTVLETIEGNTNGGVVAIRQRSAKNILGIYRPKYSTAKPSSSGSTSNGSKIETINKTYQVVSNKGMNIRKGPSVTTARVGGIGRYQTFRATRKSGNWVYAPDLKGWICIKANGDEYLREIKPPTRTYYKVITKAGLNIRTAPSVTAPKIRAVPYGTTFEASDRRGDWVKSTKLGGWLCMKSGGATYLQLIRR